MLPLVSVQLLGTQQGWAASGHECTPAADTAYSSPGKQSWKINERIEAKEEWRRWKKVGVEFRGTKLPLQVKASNGDIQPEQDGKWHWEQNARDCKKAERQNTRQSEGRADNKTMNFISNRSALMENHKLSMEHLARSNMLLHMVSKNSGWILCCYSLSTAAENALGLPQGWDEQGNQNSLTTRPSTAVSAEDVRCLGC